VYLCTYGVVDTGTDITIIGGRLFKLVATKARLKKRNLHKPNTVPRNYDGQVFTLGESENFIPGRRYDYSRVH